MQRLLLVGLNHTTAPLEIREKIAFPGDQRRLALRALRERFPEAEAVLLSTCNRVELYVARGVHGHPRSEAMVEFLANYHDVPAGEVSPHIYRKDQDEAVKHLFNVASSLDSMVLGETQILGQVREAYDLAKAESATGTLLNPLFQRAIAVGKEVMGRTALSEGRLSVASVAVDYAKQIFDHFNDKAVLSIGAGKMAQLVLQSFQQLKPGKLLICNRDMNKAVALAGKFGGVAAAFEKLQEQLIVADIVITSTGATHPIITKGMFEHLLKQRRYRPIFLIDIALPRDVEPEVGQIENVYLYNIDDLQEVVAAPQRQRQGAVGEAQGIVERQVAEFAAWNKTRELGPVIDRLYQRYHQIAADEVGRVANKLPGLSEAERKVLEQLGQRIVNKLLHDPIQTLRNGDALHGPGVQYLHAMEKLFKLEVDAGGDAEKNENEG
jgi:glutamyl-tRNA reductase